jgi:endonuclease YncB( thermonuclease family)
MEDYTPRYIKYGCVCVGDDDRPDAYDGDSVRLRLDLGHGIWIDADLLYRLAHIQAPELVGNSQPGLQAKHFLQQAIMQYQLDMKKPTGGGFWLVVKTVKKQGQDDYRPKEKKGGFGRYLVELYGKDAEGGWVNINQLMLDAGYAKPYGR